MEKIIEKQEQNSEVFIAQQYLKNLAYMECARYNAIPNMTLKDINKIIIETLPVLKNLQTEAINRFISPYQKNNSQFNQELGFKEWAAGWESYFITLMKKGNNIDFKETEEVILPEKFQPVIPDFTFEQVTELAYAENQGRGVFAHLYRKYNAENEREKRLENERVRG